MKWAFDFDTLALNLRKLKIKNVLLVSYDVFTEGLVDEIDVSVLYI